jgi:hypothetical protein
MAMGVTPGGCRHAAHADRAGTVVNHDLPRYRQNPLCGRTHVYTVNRVSVYTCL